MMSCELARRERIGSVDRVDSVVWLQADADADADAGAEAAGFCGLRVRWGFNQCRRPLWLLVMSLASSDRRGEEGGGGAAIIMVESLTAGGGYSRCGRSLG